LPSLGQAEQNPSRAVLTTNINFGDLPKANPACGADELPNGTIDIPACNQRRRWINFECAGCFASDAPRAVYPEREERREVFRNRRFLNVFFWFVFCHVTENEHPRKLLNRNKKYLEAKSKNIYFTAKKFVDFLDYFQKFEIYTKNLRFL